MAATIDPVGESSVATFTGGAALVAGDSGWFLADDEPERSLGRALAWADKQGVADLNVVVDGGEGVVARKAAQFSKAPRVYRVEGGELVPARPAEYEPAKSPPVAALDLVPLLAQSGVEIIVENGVVCGEILGLEVVRIVVDETDGARVEVGVGRHDREAFAMVHGHIPTADALASVVESVRGHRRSGAQRDLPEHPLGRMAPERWLRKVIVDSPWHVGATTLEPVESTVERKRVDEAGAAVAVGTRKSGAPLVVACSSGIDLDLVPTAADSRAVYSPEADLVIVVPERDAYAVTRLLAAALSRPAKVVTVPQGWRGL